MPKVRKKIRDIFKKALKKRLQDDKPENLVRIINKSGAPVKVSFTVEGLADAQAKKLELNVYHYDHIEDIEDPEISLAMGEVEHINAAVFYLNLVFNEQIEAEPDQNVVEYTEGDLEIEFKPPSRGDETRKARVRMVRVALR